MMARVPRIAHFVFGLRSQTEPFHVLHYVAIESCRLLNAPDAIYFHCQGVPFGLYWDLIRPHLELHRVEPVEAVDAIRYDEPIEPWRYAHHSDVIRLDALIQHGGLYCDIDAIWSRPLPVEAWDCSFLIGREGAVGDPRTGLTRASLSNAVMVAERDAPFARRWRAAIEGAMDGTWSAHSCFLAHDLAMAHPDEVTVVDRDWFSPIDYSVEAYRSLLEANVSLPPETRAVHLAAHLWWDEGRTDFSPVHGHQLHAPALARSQTTLARLVQPFVPDGALPT